MHTFADPLRRALRIASADVAVCCGSDSFTYAELFERCRRLAGALGELGVERGDRVAIWSANSHRYIETYVAVPAAGFVVVPLNTRHAEPELAYALRDSGAKVLLTDRPAGALGEIVEQVVQLPDAYDERLAAATPRDLGVGVSETDLAGLFYTGGTTGASKGVMLSHRNLIANTFHWMATVPQLREDVYLVMAPLFHAAGSNSVLGTIWTGGRQVMLPAFDPAAALSLVEEHGVTLSLGVPTMLAALAEEQHARPRETGSLRGLAHGGSPIATEVLRRCSQAFPTAELLEVYGATELSPIATILRHEERIIDEPRARSCGEAIPGVDVRVCDESGAEVAEGRVGEVVVRGPNVMQGYWNKAEQTAAVLRDGAYRTGDLGYMDGEGALYLVDRSKDMIVSGGENIYSTEVEEILYKHPGVLEAAVFGVPDEKWGEAVQAAVVLREGADDVGEAELIDFCREHIAGYKVPKGVDLRTEALPKSGPGKVLKRELRAPYWEGKDRGVN
ncbi:MAG: long-chain-fatty-acid--CoA ligase [Myxococcota bacterium]|nr:long-chain-fatty-acid--CoA ligase [Myxococcota bacterium]